MMPLLLFACAPDLSEELHGADTAALPLTTTGIDGTTHRVIDAQSEEVAVELDLDLDGMWDLSLRRYVIQLNGGISGDGNVEAAWVEGVLGSTDIPDVGWKVDMDDPDPGGDGTGGFAFGDWYDYDESTHVLTPKPRVWYVRTPLWTRSLTIDSYYDEAGTPAVYSLTIDNSPL